MLHCFKQDEIIIGSFITKKLKNKLGKCSNRRIEKHGAS